MDDTNTHTTEPQQPADQSVAQNKTPDFDIRVIEMLGFLLYSRDQEQLVTDDPFDPSVPWRAEPHTRQQYQDTAKALMGEAHRRGVRFDCASSILNASIKTLRTRPAELAY